MKAWGACAGRARAVFATLVVLAVALMIGPRVRAENGNLNAASQAAMERAIAAARQQDYKLAYRYFLEAQKADPDAPQVWFNLGLAASRIPGYEFRAIAWFKAYLLANPSAENAAAINSQVAQLEVALESRLTKVVDAIEPIAKTVVDHEVVVNVWSSKPIPNTPENRKMLRMPTYMEIGGLLAAMHLYLGDKDAAEKTRRRFFIEKGKVPVGFGMSVPAHLDRALASAGLYDELLDNKKGWPTYDSVGEGLIAADRILFATQRGDVDVAKELSNVGGANNRNYAACRYYELGRLDAAKSTGALFDKDDTAERAAELFAKNCSGWWLKKGDLAGLLARGRDGQVIVVKDNFNNVKTGEFNDTTIAEFVSMLQQHVSSLQKNYGTAQGFNLTDSLLSLADFLESYRQMRGPYDRT